VVIVGWGTSHTCCGSLIVQIRNEGFIIKGVPCSTTIGNAFSRLSPSVHSTYTLGKLASSLRSDVSCIVIRPSSASIISSPTSPKSLREADGIIQMVVEVYGSRRSTISVLPYVKAMRSRLQTVLLGLYWSLSWTVGW